VNQNAQLLIERLGLSPHPEGGFYRVTYTSDVTLPRNALPPRFLGDRAACTAIYFLLDGEDFSALHRIAADELWHFYAGSTLIVHVIDPEGNASELLLGEEFQAVVKAGCWFGARVQDPMGFALVGCTVAPGFDFADFELGKRADLVRMYPAHQKLIEALTRE
jgi:uncharacterized protein